MSDTGHAARLTSWWSPKIKLALAFVLVLCALLIVVEAGSYATEGKGFVSSEVRFSDASKSGLAIVPASCPSPPYTAAYPGECSYPGPYSCGYGYALIALGGSSGGGAGGSGDQPNANSSSATAGADGLYGGSGDQPNANSSSATAGADGLYGGVYTCQSLNSGICPAGDTGTYPKCVSPDNSCTPVFSCSGSDLYYTNGSCTSSFVQSCSYGCSAGGCIPASSLEFIPFNGTNNGSNVDLNGHLQVNPVLIRSGGTVSVYWDVGNAASCSITGTNGDGTGVNSTGIWDTLSSGVSGETSSPIEQRTIYTLTCTGLSGASPASASESQTVNVVPVFQEE